MLFQFNAGKSFVLQRPKVATSFSNIFADVVSLVLNLTELISTIYRSEFGPLGPSGTSENGIIKYL